MLFRRSAVLALCILTLVACADGTAPAAAGMPTGVRPASTVETAHLTSYLAKGATILALHTVPQAAERVVLGWVTDPARGTPSPVVWRLEGTDSTVASRFAPATSTSERLAAPPAVIRWAPSDSIVVGHYLAWLEANPPAPAAPATP